MTLSKMDAHVRIGPPPGPQQAGPTLIDSLSLGKGHPFGGSFSVNPPHTARALCNPIALYLIFIIHKTGRENTLYAYVLHHGAHIVRIQ